MKRLIIVTAGLLAALAPASSYAGEGHGGGHWRGHHGNRTVIIEQQAPSVPLIGALLLSQLLSQQQPEPLVFPDEPKAKRFYAPEPKLRRESPIPMK